MPADEEGLRFFEKNIRPLLVEHCYDCHSADYAESDLALDSWDGIVKGGKAGSVLVPGKVEQSLLMTAIRYEDHTLQMPPDSKLPAAQIALFKEWIERGAPYPGATKIEPRKDAAIDLSKEREFWAFQPIVDPALPAIENTKWPRAELDFFVLAKLEENKLTPAPPASKRELLRRATLDLTGLPPTVEEMNAFLADESPDAFKSVVERLLASPAYGEHWGRHWLDVARYADSNGLDENVAFGNAWRYRDYVVNAFNKDKPYNEFLREQIAGDLLPYSSTEQQHEQLIATGFLTLGPKVLAEVDKQKMEMDIIDEQLDTLGRGFMGLTLGCARCHDHKFDPILASDYYALAGIFKSTKTMESLKTVARWHENPIPTAADLEKKAAHEKTVADQKAKIDAVVKAANDALVATLEEGAKLPEKPEETYPAETKAELKALRDKLAEIEKAAPVMPSAVGVMEGEPTDIPIHIRGSHLTLGEVVDRRFPLVLVSTEDQQPTIPEDSSGRLELANWMASPDHPLTPRVMANRVWHWHFGRGIVDTPDNFGILGGRPTHPELLDWLSRRLVDSGWSIKQLHREIMLSSTYQMSSEYSEQSAKVDPDNRLLWRFSIRRMAAEELRDSILLVSGQLDPTMGGSLLEVENRGYLFNHTSMDATTYDSNRRSIYLPVIRNNLFSPFQLFDYSDASVVLGERPTSTVAPQALFLMNSDFVIESAETFAKLLSETTSDDTAKVHAMYDRALNRPAHPSELAQATDYLNRFAAAYAAAGMDEDAARESAWSALCQTVLASNEFIYVR